MPKIKMSKKSKTTARSVPYARGNSAVDAKKRGKAAGFTNKEVPVEFSDSVETPFFFPVPQPTSEDDWLANVEEAGQTYKQFLDENPWFSTRKQKFMHQTFVPTGNTILEKYPDGKVCLLKLGDFHEKDIGFDVIIDYVEQFLCLPAHIVKGVSIERKGNDLFFVEDPSLNPLSRSNARIKRNILETRYNAKTKHIQIHVDGVLRCLQRIVPRDALCLIGLTNYDLYGDPTDLFIAGVATGNGRVATFSLFRYNPALSFSKEFWYEINITKRVGDEERKRLAVQRGCKLVVHEICHLLGVGHCIYYGCCMNGSGHLQEDFDQPMTLCPIDLHKLQTLIGFDVTIRYRKLLHFFIRHNLQEESDWMKRRIEFIESNAR